MSVDIVDRVYDAYAGELGQHFMRETQRRIHWMCGATEGNLVLDVGCSQGLVPILLGREGKSVVGIDCSSAVIRSAEQRLETEPLSVRKRVTFVEGDFATHRFDEQPFDCLLMGEVLEHLLQPARFIERAAAHLAEGGRLVVTVPFGVNDHVDHKHTFYLLEPYRLLAQHFEIIEVSLLGKWLGLIGIRRGSESVPGTHNWSDEQLSQLERAFQQVERQLLDDANSLRAKLDEANTKYRGSTEEVARLKREVAHHDAERKATERVLKEATSSAATEPHGAARLGSELSSERELRHERELALARLEEQFKHAADVRALELQLREAEINTLANARAALEAQLREVEQTRDQERNGSAQLAAAQLAELESMATSTADLKRRLLASQGQIDELKARTTAVEQGRLAESERQQLELRTYAAEVESLRRQLLEAREAAHQQSQHQAELTRQVAGAREALLQCKAELAETAAERSTIQARLAANSAESKDLALHEQKQNFERILETQRNLLRAAESQSAQLKAELAAARASDLRTKLLLDTEKRERASAERRVVQTRNTLSFQLGYELIHGFKSRNGLLGLPKHLWQLQQEATRRRRDRDSKHQVPLRPLQSELHTSASAPGSTSADAPSALSPSPRRVTRPLAATTVSEPMLGRQADLKQLRIGCILDEFTFASFAPECTLLQLTPSDWQSEIEAFQPQLLFVESAWRGKNDLWSRKIAHRADELVAIVAWCKSRRIPTAFWNKEDPVHYRTFLNTAKLFDIVFTTDIDCIPRYKRVLGHDRVHLLPFAVQPKAHSPLEKYSRKDGIAFAGAYYARYPERQADLAGFADSFSASPRLDIFDRNHGKSDPDYQFPQRYAPHIVGTLAFDEIDRAYKGYRYALNLNSIKNSQTMFARRVFELLGSNTITVSNFSRGVRLMFGDLVITTDHGGRAASRLQSFHGDDSVSRRFRLAGLRKVLHEHTYGERLRFISARVWGKAPASDLPTICVLAPVWDRHHAERVLTSFDRQVFADKRLLLIACGDLDLSGLARANVQVIGKQLAAELSLRDATRGSTHVAPWWPSDYYGRNYLLDLALATRYSEAPVLGKLARYRRSESALIELVASGARYSPARTLPARAALVLRESLPQRAVGAWLEALETHAFEDARGFAVDEFNYCENGAELGVATLAELEDLPQLDTGVSMERLVRASEAVTTTAQDTDAAPQPQIDAPKLASLFRSGPNRPIALRLEGEHLAIKSSIPDGSHEYIYARESWPLAALRLPESGKLHFEASPGLNVQLAVLFLDDKKQRLGHKLCQSGSNEVIVPPKGANAVQLALRIYGSGSARISGILLDHVCETPEVLLGRGDYLLITNRYPSYDDLYRNGFVHRRVLEYAKQGLRLDVFRIDNPNRVRYHEFEGVDVISGGSAALEALLRSNSYKAILVHFMDQLIWQSVRPILDKTRLLIWAHGAEIQAWHRREAHFGTQGLLEGAKAEAEPRRQFWRHLLQQLPDGSKVVFVSRQFAEEVMSDLDLRLPETRYSVIHNVIDTTLFEYREKTAEQRLRILSIRPYTSRIYGNDLTVAAILALAERPYFSELQFHLVGDGPLFEQTLAPLRGLPNVQIDRRFLSQAEIAELHQSYGVFLCPSRGDTQGVSRDEAMSSGLVPITNRAGAIPEFVDSHCSILAEREDALGLAAGIERMYETPRLFLELSAGAARRVRAQSSPERTTALELSLIRGDR